MKIKFIIIFLFLTFVFVNSKTVLARPIISGMSTNEINIDTNFSGTEILLFGAKAEAGNIIIAVRGPKKDYMVSKKGKFLGVWYNQKRVKFEDAYSYYTLFTTDFSLNEDQKLLSDLEIGQNNIKFNVDGKVKTHRVDEFRSELVGKLGRDNLYADNYSEIEFLDETLFKVNLKFPKNISSGVYTVEIYLIDDDNVIAFQSIPINVNQVGISAKIHNMAYGNSFLYGLIAVFLALASGLIANFVFNKFFGK